MIRLVTANWLAYFELPEDKRPKPDLAAVLLDLYQFGPELPAQARGTGSRVARRLAGHSL